MKRVCVSVLITFWVILWSCPVVRAQSSDANKSTEELLTNETIVSMTKAGFSPTLIVSKIKSSKTTFNVSTPEMLRLKHEGVAEVVIEVMVLASQLAVTTNGQPVSAKTDPHNPLSPHEAGIYLMKENDGRHEMLQLEPSIYSQAKSGGFFKSAMTYGIAKVKSKAVLAGEHAKLQVNEARPVFYFYFELKNAGLSGSGNQWLSSATSPNEFVLIRMESKKNSREVTVGQFNVFGAQGGALDKYTTQFDYEKLASGVYKVTPKENLANGEYCFFYGGAAPQATYGMVAAGSPKVFDFGVRVERLH
jgi:hypothetical protein